MSEAPASIIRRASVAEATASIIRRVSVAQSVKYTPLVKGRRDSDESRVLPEEEKRLPWVWHDRNTLGLVLLMLLFVVSILGTVVMWATDMYDATINERLVLRNNSDSFSSWIKSPVRPAMKFHVFNYTNVEAFRRGDDERLQVEEVGPYTFKEQLERVDVSFDGNDTVTYREKRTYEFIPEMSNGSLNDSLVVVNIPLMTLNHMQRRSSLLQRLPIAAGLRIIDPQPFHVKTAQQLFWGYEDTLTKLASIRLQDVRVGLLQQKNGTSPYTVTINTGEKDLSRLGTITLFDGKEQVDFYSTAECNRVDGTDGSKFPPPLVVPGGTLYIYQRDVCRRVPLVYQQDVKVFNGVPALRFVPPTNIFDDGDSNPENACYCIESTYDMCQLSGVMGTSNCKNNVPLFVSFPHFYLGDKRLLEAVDGLKPHQEKHSMYLDIHQRIGVPIRGMSRFQFNILVKNSFNNMLLAGLDDKLLPIVWLERDLGEFPHELQKLFYTASITVENVRHALQFGSLGLLVVTSVTLLVFAFAQLTAALRSAPAPAEVYVMTRL